jgi:hypothetical protein
MRERPLDAACSFGAVLLAIVACGTGDGAEAPGAAPVGDDSGTLSDAQSTADADCGGGEPDVIPATGLPKVAERAGTPFATAIDVLTGRANEFWSIYGAADAPGDFTASPVGLNSAWSEWDTRKFAWTPRCGQRARVFDFLRAAKINGMDGAIGTMPDGFLWTWGDSETWPDAASANHGGKGSMHFDQIPRYPSAVAMAVLWTGDRSLLATLLPRAEKVMEGYAIGQMKGDTDVLTIPLADNDGAGTRPSNYHDQVRFGYQDAWTNASYLTALNGMAELEDFAGNTAKRDRYRTIAAAFGARYDAAFWNDATKRYAGWRDKNGTLHDHGYTFVNLEAFARGLGDVGKAQDVFDWLEQPAIAVQGGVHTGSTDPYQHVIAPRSTTLDVPLADWDGWSDPPTGGRKPYGTNVENGGTLLMTAYFEAEARLRYQDADAALDALERMLGRIAADSHRLTFTTNTRVYDDFGEDIVELGTNVPFPESGQAIIPLLDGFVGARAVSAGLAITPSLPASLLDLRVRELELGGKARTLVVSRGSVTLGEESADGVHDLVLGQTLDQELTTSAPFDEVAVYLGTYVTTDSAATLRLEQAQGSSWTTIAARRFVSIPDNHWLHLATIEAAPGDYRLVLEDPAGRIAWYANSKSALGGAHVNGASTPGAFAFRAIHTVREVTLAQPNGTLLDPFTSSIGQTFTSVTPFDGVAVNVHAEAGAGFTASLSRDVGGRWGGRQTFVVRGLAGDTTVVFHFATQAPGKYWLDLSNPVGTVAWPRTDTDALTDPNTAATIDSTTIAGDRIFEVSRQRFRVTVPEDAVDVLVRSGATFTLLR